MSADTNVSGLVRENLVDGPPIINAGVVLREVLVSNSGSSPPANTDVQPSGLVREILLTHNLGIRSGSIVREVLASEAVATPSTGTRTFVLMMS